MKRGAILLELIVSLAIFVGAGLAVLGVSNQATGALERNRLQQRARDHARSALSLIEAGLASPESLHSEPPAWLETTFDESAPDSPWTIEVETEPSAYTDLALVTVSAAHDTGASYTLRQLVRLARYDEDAIGEEDELLDEALRGMR